MRPALPLLSLILAACGGAAPRDAMSPPPNARAAVYTADAPEQAPVAPAAPGAPVPVQHAMPAQKPPAPPANPTGAKTAEMRPATNNMLIYSGQLQMLADQEKLSETLDKVIDVAESMGGHLAGRSDASVTVKVPSPRFRETLTKLEGVGTVIHRSVSAQDVTEEYHDIEVRLANLKATRARIQEFLNKAGNIPDALTVERELERVAVEIDRLEGRLRFLKERSALSEIVVGVQARPKPPAEIVREPNKPPPPPPPPEPRLIDLPVGWVSDLGIFKLLRLR